MKEFPKREALEEAKQEFINPVPFGYDIFVPHDRWSVDAYADPAPFTTETEKS